MAEKPTYEELEQKIKKLEKEAEKPKQTEEELKRNMEYFQLLSDLANTFIKIPPREFAKTIEYFLKHIVEFFDVDRGALIYLPEGNPSSRESYSWNREGIEPFRWDNSFNKFAYMPERIGNGEIFSFSNIDDLPSEAKAEKDYFLIKGTKSVIDLPLMIEGRIIGILLFGSFRKTKTWSIDLVQQLQLVSQTFANSLERKHAEELLRESEERFRSFMDSAIEGFSLWDSELNLIAFNETLARLFSYAFKKEDSMGKNILEFTPGLEKISRYDQYLDVIKSGEPLLLHDVIPHSKFGDRYLNIKAFKAGGGLGMIVEDVTERKQVEEEKERLINELTEAFDNIKTLKGLLPICASCKKIRDDKGYWNQIEGYIQTHSDVSFSHGLCPECMEKLYGDEDWYKKGDFDK